MIKVYNMDVLAALKKIPSESVDMQITSPPYWGLRDYGVEGIIWDGDENCEHEWGKNYCQLCGSWKGQLGLEPNFNLFIKHLCDIFDEVKRVLKKDGTCWVNLGDTYSGGIAHSDWSSSNKEWEKKMQKAVEGQKFKGMKKDQIQAKCLIGIPERFAIEMINRGWILRNKIIWHKPNHMPTSVKDRFANSWEYLFFFSKSKKYYFDLDAVREKYSEVSEERFKTGFKNGSNYNYEKRITKGMRDRIRSRGLTEGFKYEVAYNNPKGKNPDDVVIGGATSGLREGYEKRLASSEYDKPNPLGKQPDDFWDITTRGYPEAHFAVFPEKLVERPIKTTRKNAVIMDIFVGSGTTLKVARDLKRNSIGIEIKPDYCDLIKKRLFKGNVPLFDDFEIITV